MCWKRLCWLGSESTGFNVDKFRHFWSLGEMSPQVAPCQPRAETDASAVSSVAHAEGCFSVALQVQRPTVDAHMFLQVR